jgi:hypothetical protein
MKEILLAPVRYVVYVNGNFHSEVMAFSREEALEEVLFSGTIGRYVYDMDAELYTGSDEPEEDYYPRSLYGN